MSINSSKWQSTVQDLPLARLLFSDRRFAVVWLVIRVLVGLEWLNAGLHKVEDPGWTATGEALKGFWERIVVVPETGRAAINYDWYRSFIQSLLDAGSYTWFAKLVAYGELLIGVALIIGAFVGIAAFFGGLMNFNFIMAGSASSNGLLFAAAVLLILAWKTAGYLGADYYLLQWIGTPWNRGEKAEAAEIRSSQRNVA